MVKTGLISNLNKYLFDERTAYTQHQTSETAEAYRDSQKAILANIKAIGRTKDVGQILASERTMLENEAIFYSNSPSMTKSLNNALNELNGSENTFNKVHDPAIYQKEVNDSYLSHKNRVGDLPNDEARQFFKSQSARLLNMDKSRLDDTEKSIIMARRDNMIAGGSAYVKLQKHAMGIAPTASKSKAEDLTL